MGASNGLRAYWFLIFPAIGLAFWGIRRLKNTEPGRQRWDRIKLKLPMKVGDVVQKIALARFSRTLATLMSAGVDIITALEITGGTAGNYVIEQALVTRARARARRRPDQRAACRRPGLPADGQPDGEDRRGDG